MATSRPKSTFRKQGGYVEKCQNISISSRCKFDRFFRVTTCQQPRRLQHVSSRRRRSSSEHVVPAAKRHFSRRIWPQTPRDSLCSLAPLGSLTPLGSSGSYVYAHMRFLSPHLPGLLSIVCDGQGPTGSAMATFRPKSTFRKQGGYVQKCQNISISNRCKFDRFFRVTTCQQPRRLQHVFSRRRRPSSEHVVPAAKRHFSRRIWPQTPRGSLCSLAPLVSLTPLGSPGSYVYAHMRFLYSHLPGLLPIVCDGQDRLVQRWPLFGRNRPFASRGGTFKSVKISRFQIDANLTDSFALRRASGRGDSNTCFIRRRRPSSEHVVPAAKRHFIRRIWPQTTRGSLGSLAPHYRRALTCMHTCIFVFLSQWYWRYLTYKEFY